MSPVEWEDILDLADNLMRERHFLSSEKKQLQQLNDKVANASSKLAQQAWVAAQLRIALNKLILSNGSPAACCMRANQLECISFIDGHKRLGFQESLQYGSFLQSLRTSPQLLASCLVAAERAGLLQSNLAGSTVHTLLTGLFGACQLAEDERLVLRLLRHLIALQVAPSPEPRRMLRPASCVFARLYSAWHEGLFGAKLFLTAALHDSILQMLAEDDIYLDIDPDKALVRYPPSDRIRKFGTEGTPEFALKLQEHRTWTIGRLTHAVKRFIQGIQESLYVFPAPVKWLVRQLHLLLSESGRASAREVSVLCTDLVFGSFICPAVVNPEPWGVTELPVSSVARFNLIQVAQVLQMLALWRWEEPDPRTRDLYSHFDKECLSMVVESILEGPDTLEEEEEDEEEVAAVSGGLGPPALFGISRSAALFTEHELQLIVGLLQGVAGAAAGEETGHGIDTQALASLLAHLPPSHSFVCNGTKQTHQHTTGTQNRLSTAVSSNSLHPSPPGTPSPRKQSGLLSKVGRNRVSRTLSTPVAEVQVNGGPGEDGGDEETIQQQHLMEQHSEEVLVLPLGGMTNIEYIGLLPESKVLARPELSGACSLDTRGVTAAEVQTQEKRTRFSLSHDEGSIVSTGNVSDNLEAVSEAASNHSAASSLDIEEGGEGEEDPPDNLSDMVSANVSGRGTPSISGRDTPSSQVTEGEETQGPLQGLQQRGGSTENNRTPQLGDFVEPVAPSAMPGAKQHSRSDIDDKFGKFEIKKLIEGTGDETFSLVSDTWSTDVLASDSETVEQSSEHNFPTTAHSIGGLAPPLPRGMPGTEPGPPGALDVSETASEAWSIDVAASDSERLGEVDTDDTGSVARSDDTARSEIDGDATRDTPPLQGHAAGMAFRPIRVELPAVRETAVIAPFVVQPRVALTSSSASSTLTRDSSTSFLPPSPPALTNKSLASSLTGSETDAPPGLATSGPSSEAGTKLRALEGGKARMLSTSTRSEDSTDSKQASSSLGLDVEVGASPAPRLSTTSLASSSSSSAGGGAPSDHRGNSSTPVLQEIGSSDLPETTLRDKGSTPSTSTGAIPKSISFDKTAERGDKELDDDPKHKRGSFFRSFKLPFKSRGRKPSRGGHDETRGSELNDTVYRCRRLVGDAMMDSEEILAKYRRKPGNNTGTISAETKAGKGGEDEEEEEDERLHIDPLHPEQSYAFADAKRKLRLVLSTADAEGIRSNVLTCRRGARGRTQERISVLLRLQLTEARNVQDEALLAHIHEALRCVRLFDDGGCRKLLQSLREDYFKRAPYVAYMTRSKIGLLDSLAHLKRLKERVRRERHISGRYLIAVCVRLFLEQRESRLSQFETDFQQLTMPDEKTDLLDSFLMNLASEMERDSIWRASNETQLEIARQAVEQAVIGRVYLHALYPNGEGDISRDQVLHEHIKRLSEVITLNHKDLRVPKAFQYECPWPSAQAELAVLGACKTPRDKVRCIVDCAKTIMYLLGLAGERSVPAADDFTPVLVYVIIKANPPSLLSTIQYVNSFYRSQLQGEEEYWWVQFCSAIEHIKTMDYLSPK